LVPELVYCVQWRAEWNRTSQQDHDAFAVSHDASFDDTWCHVARSCCGLGAVSASRFSKILNAQVWIDAFGQAFFSLSVAMGVYCAYGSYLPRKSDITNNALLQVSLILVLHSSPD